MKLSPSVMGNDHLESRAPTFCEYKNSNNYTFWTLELFVFVKKKLDLENSKCDRLSVPL